MIITQKLAIYYDDNTLLSLGFVERTPESAALFPMAATIGRISFDDSTLPADGTWFT